MSYHVGRRPEESGLGEAEAKLLQKQRLWSRLQTHTGLRPSGIGANTLVVHRLPDATVWWW
jgi:hypothetical protein